MLLENEPGLAWPGLALPIKTSKRVAVLLESEPDLDEPGLAQPMKTNEREYGVPLSELLLKIS